MSSDNNETRTNILEAASQLLEVGATKAVRMSDIARQAGVSRQAVYLHFSTRAELLIAATHHVDHIKGPQERLRASRSSQTGSDGLDTYIEAWGNYIPEIYGFAKALLAMKDSDEAAAQAWEDRLQAMHRDCAAVIKILKEDGVLSPNYTQRQATDILFTLLSVHNWEQLTVQCNWSQKRYLKMLKAIARGTLVVQKK